MLRTQPIFVLTTQKKTRLAIDITTKIGEAVEYVLAKDEGYFVKYCTFFAGRFAGIIQKDFEKGHVLTWLAPELAVEKLHFRSQRWAIEQALKRAL